VGVAPRGGRGSGLGAFGEGRVGVEAGAEFVESVVDDQPGLSGQAVSEVVLGDVAVVEPPQNRGVSLRLRFRAASICAGGHGQR
jgi:hypothetical protein